MKLISTIAFLYIIGQSLVMAGETDSLPYKLFNNKFIFHINHGINGAPFNIRNVYTSGARTLIFKNNIQPTLGFGIAYRGIGVQAGIALPIYTDSVKTHGETDYLDIGVKLSIKQFLVAADIRKYNGYYVENASYLVDSLNPSFPNEIRANAETFSASLNMWYFMSKRYNLKAVNGIIGHYQGKAGSWYFKATSNYFQVQDNRLGLAPIQLRDSIENVLHDIHYANKVGAFDFGLVPGYAFVRRKRTWQIGFCAGLGGVIQTHYYIKDPLILEPDENDYVQEITLAPRIDLKGLIGISRPNFFVLLNMDFDIKSIRIKDFKYDQTFYDFKICTGFRVGSKKSKQKEI